MNQLNVDALNNSAQCCFRARIKISDLEIGKRYKIEEIRRIKTQFGPAILIGIENQRNFFLPKRCINHFTEEYCSSYQPNSIGITVLGQKGGLWGDMRTTIFKFD